MSFQMVCLPAMRTIATQLPIDIDLTYCHQKGAATSGKGFHPMTDIIAAKNKLLLAQRHVESQRQRIARHTEFIAEFKRSKNQEILSAALELLARLERTLAGMVTEEKRARAELAHATTRYLAGLGRNRTRAVNRTDTIDVR
jgi:hypothetical protein